MNMTTQRPLASALLLMAAAILLTPPATAQSPAPSPGVEMDCTSYIVNMSDCLSYVEAGSNLTVPDTACCPELAGMLGSKPLCLCQLLSSTDTFGIQISLTKAMNLPSACRVSTPPITVCSAAGYPIGGSSPTEAPKSPDHIPGVTNDGGSLSITVSQLFYLLGLAITTLSTFFCF